MEGWTEDEVRNRALMAPCGLYCGTCGVYIATRDGNEKFRAVMGNLYGTRPEETECLGCMQEDSSKKLYAHCTQCKVRECVKSKGYYSCHQCDEWPCAMIENFGFATGVRVMKKTVPVEGLFHRDERKAARHTFFKGRDQAAQLRRVASVK